MNFLQQNCLLLICLVIIFDWCVNNNRIICTLFKQSSALNTNAPIPASQRPQNTAHLVGCVASNIAFAPVWASIFTITHNINHNSKWRTVQCDSSKYVQQREMRVRRLDTSLTQGETHANQLLSSVSPNLTGCLGHTNARINDVCTSHWRSQDKVRREVIQPTSSNRIIRSISHLLLTFMYVAIFL